MSSRATAPLPIAPNCASPTLDETVAPRAASHAEKLGSVVSTSISSGRRGEPKLLFNATGENIRLARIDASNRG